MKNFRWILPIFFMLFCFGGISQNNTIIDTNYIWCNHFTACGGCSEYSYKLRIGSPVSTNEFKWHTVYAALNTQPDTWWQRTYIREDSTQKVWRSDDTLSQGFVIYDFNLQPGDTLGWQVCDSIDTVFLDNKYRKRIFLHCSFGGATWFNDTWVEGMLNLRSPIIQPGANGAFTQADYVRCIRRNDTIVFGDTACICNDVYPTITSPNSWTATNRSDWYYDYLEENPYSTESPNEGYVFIRAGMTYSYLGHLCKKMYCTIYDHTGQAVRNHIFYTYFEDNKVYYTFNQTFSVLYDYTARAGDSWTIRNPYEIYGLPLEPDSMSVITVDSATMQWEGTGIGTIQLFTHSSTAWRFQPKLLAKTGGPGFMFPGKWDEWDYPYPGGLRCYFNSLPFYPPIPANCISLTTDIDQPANPEQISIFQQNNDGYLHVRTLKNGGFSGKAILLDLQGRLLFQSEYSNSQTFTIPMRNNAPGLYFVRLQDERGVVSTLKAVYTGL